MVIVMIMVTMVMKVMVGQLIDQLYQASIIDTIILLLH